MLVYAKIAGPSILKHNHLTLDKERSMPHISPFHAWMLAIRPKTLPTAVAPVVVGAGLAAAAGKFSPLPALAALAGALLLQIAVNLANDYFDFVRGIDSGERLGPIRVTQSGLIPPERVRAAMIAVLVLAALVGTYLMAVGGWPIVAIGLCSILFALAYSGGPFPLASHGLGDAAVFVFYGPVAVCGTYWVQALDLTAWAVAASLPAGCLITAVLVVNNLRDIPTDRKAGKRTLAVMLGTGGTVREYQILIFAAYAVPALQWAAGWALPWDLLPLLSLPLAVFLIRSVAAVPPPDTLNRILARTAILALIYCVLQALGLILS
jgi:1,4-dihydroxy-2-naphthoate polyprenyltransferase